MDHKRKREKEGGKIWKARLVAKRFTEKLGNKYECEAPTCSTEGLKMVVMVIKIFEWNVKTLDMKTAYLQGKEMTRGLCQTT